MNRATVKLLPQIIGSHQEILKQPKANNGSYGNSKINCTHASDFLKKHHLLILAYNTP